MIDNSEIKCMKADISPEKRAVLYDLFSKMALEDYARWNCIKERTLLEKYYNIDEYLDDPNSEINQGLFGDKKLFILQARPNTNEFSVIQKYLEKMLSDNIEYKDMDVDGEDTKLKDYGKMLIITQRFSKFKKLRNEYKEIYGVEFGCEIDENNKYDNDYMIIHHRNLYKLKKKYHCVVVDMGYFIFEKISEYFDDKNPETEKILNNYSFNIIKLLCLSSKIIYIDYKVISFHIDFLKNFSFCENNYCIVYNGYNYNYDNNKGLILFYDNLYETKSKMREKLNENKRILILNNDENMVGFLKKNNYKKYDPFFLNKNNIENFSKQNGCINDFLKKNNKIKMLICDESVCLDIDFESNIFDSIFLIIESGLGKIYNIALSCLSIKNFNDKEIHMYIDQDYEMSNFSYEFYLKMFYNDVADPDVINNTNKVLRTIIGNNKVFHCFYLESIYRSYGRNILIYILYGWGYFLKKLV